MINILTPSLKAYSATIGNELRNYSVEVPSGPVDKLFFFFKASIDTLKSQQLFSKYLKDAKAVGIYAAPLNRVGGRAKAEWSLKEDFDKDLAFFQHIISQFPTLRVCITGISQGAEFALQLAASGYVKWVTTFAGSTFKGMIISSKPNVYAVHGKLDVSVRFGGGVSHGYDFYSAYDSILKFTTPPVTSKSINLPLGGHLITYTSPNQTNRTQLFVGDNEAHAIMSSYRGIDLIKSMFDFFSVPEIAIDDKL